MTQALTFTAETIREVQEQIDADSIPDAYLDFVELTDELITRGWGTTPAKSTEHGHVDQPMLQHIGNAVVVLVSLYEITGAFSEKELRNMIALIAAHDYHKLRSNPDPEKEFEITTAEVKAFIEETGLADYAPDVSTAEFHAAICALHKRDSRARIEVAPVSFDEYRPYLNFADTIASRADPGDFVDHSRTQELREALGEEYTINYHKLRTSRGLFTNIVNKSIADGLEAEQDLDLFSIYHNGCTYLGDQRCAETPVTDDELEEIYSSLVSNLRTAHTAFQNPEHMLSGFSTSQQRHYRITDRDFVFASQEEILRNIVYKCVNAADKSGDLVDEVTDPLDALEQHVPDQLDRTHRIDGIARLVHTVYAEIAPFLGEDHDPLEITYDAFGTTAETRNMINNLVEENPDNIEPTAKRFPIKYLIAQDVIDRYYTGYNPREIMNTLADDLTNNLSRFSGWDTLHNDRADDIYDELKAFILYNTEVDGTRMIRKVGGRDEYDRYNDRITHCCALCNNETSATPSEGFRLLKSYPPDLEVTHYDGTTRMLARAENGYAYCYPCQLDLALRLTHEEEEDDDDTDGGRDKLFTDDDTGTDNDNLYVHMIPDYFYAPFLWRIYRSIIDSYFRFDTTNTLELADSVLNSNSANGFQNWLKSTLDSDVGPEFTYEQKSAFNSESGFGTHPIRRDSTHTISETEELLVVLSATAYAGVRAFITESPTTSICGDEFDTAVKLSEEFDICEYTGPEIPLSALDDLLTIIAAMHRLTDALDRQDTDPLEGLDTLTNLATLPGATMLSQLASKDTNLAVEYLPEARAIDTQLVDGHRPDSDAGWPIDITVSSDPVALWDATASLAETAWSLMHPDAVDVDTLCAPIEAALEATQDACDGDDIPRHLDLRARIEQAVESCPQVSTAPQAGRPDPRITAFADQFIALIDAVCDGDPRALATQRRSITSAYYAAILDRATTTFEMEDY